jgi:MFS family permease
VRVFEERLRGKLFGINPKKVAIVSSLPLSFLFLNLHMTSYFSLAIDNELGLTRESPNTWLLEGRWGSTFIEGAFGSGVVPWVSYLVFALLFSAAFVIWTLTIQREIDWKVPLAFILSSAFPGLWVLLIFRANVIPAGFAYLLSALSVFLVTRLYPTQKSKVGKFIALGAASVSLGFAVAIYQAFFTVFLLGVFAVGLFIRMENRELTWFWVRSLTVLILSLGIFQIVNELLRGLMRYETGGYISNFWRPIEIWGNPIEHVLSSIAFALSTIFVSESAFGLGAGLAAFLIGTAAISLVFRKDNNSGFAIAISASGLLLAPFAIPFLASGPDNTPIRSLVALPMFFAVATYLALSSKSFLLRVWGIGLAVTISIQFLSITGEYSAVDRLRNEFDAALASQIYAKLDSGCSQDSPDLKVAFIGNKHFTTNLAMARGSTFGSSIFSWDNLSSYPWRVNALMQARGYEDFSAVQLANLDVPEGQISEMKPFPSDSSVICFEGTHIVKLSEVD